MTLQVPDYIRSLIPYVPGKPIEETQREFNIKRVVKLASNENPLGASPKALRAIQMAAKDLHRYPDGGGFRLKKALSTQYGIKPSQIILGNGSNEIIDHLIRTYCVPGDAVVTHRGAFIAYKICAQVHGVTTLEVPVDAELSWDVEELLQSVRNNSKVRIVFLANPNNPTGAYFDGAKLDTLVKGLASIRDGSVVLVLDYAYWEYVRAKDLPDPIKALTKYRHTVILRTFSKIHGLAGLRVGYGVASPEMISDLEKVRQPFNVGSLALVGAEAALFDLAFIKRSRALNERALGFWEKGLSRLGIPFWKSQGNFLLADVQKGIGKSASDLTQACLARGVIFRPIANYGFPGLLRITMGTSDENEMALEVLSDQRTGANKNNMRGKR